MATQTLTLVSATDDQDETTIEMTIIVEADGNTLSRLRALDPDGAEYDVRLELTAKDSMAKDSPHGKKCCEDTGAGMHCYSGPCRPHH